jgi:transposase InsO family protein
MKLQNEFPVSRVCVALDLARSAFYYESSSVEAADLRDEMEKIALAFPRYGYRRMTAELNRRKWSVNHKRVLRLMREYHLLIAVKRYCRTTFSQHTYGRYPNLVKDLEIVRPDQVWVADITYIRVARDFLYLAVLMDLFTRSIRGWVLSRSLSEDFTLAARQCALRFRQPEIHHSDQGVQYAATSYTQLLQDKEIRISMAAQGEPTENAFAERLMRTLKEEEVYLHEYQDYADARIHIARFLDDVYMHKRLHSALGYVPPAEFEANYRQAQSVALKG